MSTENGKCPGCGQVMNLDNTKEKMICKYCGNEVVIIQAVQKCQIDGLTSFDALILAAEQAIEYDEDYDKALKKYREALDMRPNDYRVLWGIFLCEMDFIDWYRRTKGFVQFPNDIPTRIDETLGKWGQRAYTQAPDDVKPYYMQIMNEFKNSAPPQQQKKKKGCYIATAVYGSYDCPEVWTLRRYRDYALNSNIFGRLFVKSYYAVSPTLVKLFAGMRWFNAFWEKRLNRKIASLEQQGFLNTPYSDL